MFYGRAGHLVEFYFQHKRLERRRFEYARNSNRDEFFDFPPRSSLVLHLALLHALFLSSLIDLTIAYMVLVHERTTLSLDALVMAHVLIVVIIYHIGLVFLQESFTPILSWDTWTVHIFPVMVLVPLVSNGDVQKIVKTSSGLIVKCWIPKIHLTNPSTEPLTFSRSL
jgi:hypothetical protein